MHLRKKYSLLAALTYQKNLEFASSHIDIRSFAPIFAINQWPMASLTRQNYFKFLVTGLFVGAFGYMLMPFLVPSLLAAIFALAVKPIFDKYRLLPKMKWRISVALRLLILLVVLGTVLFLTCYKVYTHLQEIAATGVKQTELFKALVELSHHSVIWGKMILRATGLAEKIDLQSMSDNLLSKFGDWTVGASGAMASGIPDVALATLVFFGALYIFISESSGIKKLFIRLKLLSDTDAHHLIQILQKSAYNTVITSVIIGAGQAFIVTLGAAVFNAGDPFIVFVVTFIMSFVPVVGAGPVALLLGLYKILIGATPAGLGLIILAGVTGAMDNIIRPYLISSGEVELHPIVGLFTVVGAVMAFGMPGLFLGPVITAGALQIPALFFGTSRR